MRPDENVSDWVRQAVAARPPRDAIRWQLDFFKASSDARRRHIYYSPYRPVSYVWAKDHLPRSVLIFDVAGGTKSLIATRDRLPLGASYKLELYPLNRQAEAGLVYDYYRALGKLAAVELAREPGSGPGRAALVGRDPSRPGRFRATWFEEDLGPTGHLEGTSMLELIAETLGEGYRLIQPGVVDALMSTVGD